MVWQCSEGRFNWYYDFDETILILEGSIVLENDTMGPTRYGPGDVIFFKDGAHSKWHVEGHVKKLASVLSEDPAGPARLRVAGVLQDQENPDAGRETPAREPDGFRLRGLGKEEQSTPSSFAARFKKAAAPSHISFMTWAYAISANSAVPPMILPIRTGTKKSVTIG
jgi:hypothetical protein